MDDLLHIIKFTLYLRLLIDYLGDLGRLDLELFLLTLKMCGESKFLFLLEFEFLRDPNLLPPLFFKRTFGFQQFLFLPHCFFHSLRTSE